MVDVRSVDKVEGDEVEVDEVEVIETVRSVGTPVLTPPAPPTEHSVFPNLLNPALLPRLNSALMAGFNPLNPGVPNPAVLNQLQHLQRLHSQNQRLIGKLDIFLGQAFRII